MPAFDLFALITGILFILALGVTVGWVLFSVLTDPDLERIAEQRGDYRVWGEGNNV